MTSIRSESGLIYKLESRVTRPVSFLTLFRRNERIDRTDRKQRQQQHNKNQQYDGNRINTNLVNHSPPSSLKLTVQSSKRSPAAEQQQQSNSKEQATEEQQPQITTRTIDLGQNSRDDYRTWLRKGRYQKSIQLRLLKDCSGLRTQFEQQQQQQQQQQQPKRMVSCIVVFVFCMLCIV
jgi:hypothetical protein